MKAGFCVTASHRAPLPDCSWSARCCNMTRMNQLDLLSAPEEGVRHAWVQQHAPDVPPRHVKQRMEPDLKLLRGLKHVHRQIVRLCFRSCRRR